MKQEELLDERQSLNLDAVIYNIREIALKTIAAMWIGLGIVYHFFSDKFPAEIWSFLGLVIMTSLLEMLLWNLITILIGKVHKPLSQKFYSSLKMSLFLIIYRGICFLLFFPIVAALSIILSNIMNWTEAEYWSFVFGNYWLGSFVLILVDIFIVFFVFNSGNIDKKRFDAAKRM